MERVRSHLAAMVALEPDVVNNLGVAEASSQTRGHWSGQTCQRLALQSRIALGITERQSLLRAEVSKAIVLRRLLLYLVD